MDTDAIDNSAGVDTSDHEVNIKILTGMLERSGQLTRKRRDTLLQSMTDDVAAHVLAHNYDQTLALSLMEMDAAGELEPYAQFMAQLEAEGRLDRAVEGLPDRAEIADGFLHAWEADHQRVERYYTDYLGRDGDAGEVASWLDALQSRRLSPDAVAEAFLASEEFFARADVG